MRRAAAGLAVVAVVAVAVGCGGPSAAEREAERAAQVRYLATGVRTWQLEQRRSAAAKAWSRCSKQLAGLRSSVGELRAALGDLYLEDYTIHVGEIRKQYDKLEIATLADACIAVAVHLERAANLYSSVIRPWALCDLVSSCDIKKRDKIIQEGWSLAIDQQAFATAALKRMRTNPPAGVIKAGSFSTSVPENAGDVEQSVYGLALQAYCGTSMDISAAEACTTLREILPNGVEQGELSDLDEAVEQLNEAQNLSPEQDSA